MPHQHAKVARGLTTAVLFVTCLSATSALATPGDKFSAAGVVNGHFGELNINTSGDKTGKWGLHLKTLDDTDIGADRLTVQPGGFSGWHAHPSPTFVTVTKGTIQWYDAALCTPHSYSQGDSFIEPAYGVHNVRNNGSETAEFIAIVIKPEGFVGPAFRLDRPTPSAC